MPDQPWVWSDLRGLNKADPATRLPSQRGTDALNVLLEPMSLGRRRPSLATLSLTSGPTATIYQVARAQPAESIAAQRLYTFSGTVSIHTFDGSAWSSVSASGAGAFDTNRPHAAMFNGKLFYGHNTTDNRLWVIDLAGSVTTARRVGIVRSAAPSVADTGAGSYAATIRYYRIQWKLRYGTRVAATSELSAATSFTPSGSGTHARVTKPTTPDSATHWVVFGSADNVTYYNLSGDVAVGTTTYDDNAAPSAYSANTVAPTDGLHVPPPSAKYLLADGNRLLMAGCWETTGTGTAGVDYTDPRNSRVWFTDLLGARDNSGEDESIPQTVDYKAYVDCGENDGEAIIGLAGPLDGIVYVFKQRSIWRLIPTGIPDAPYRSERWTSATSAVHQDGIGMGEDAAGNPALYFSSDSGPKRIVSGFGVEDLGADVRDTTSPNNLSVASDALVLWDRSRRIVWWISPGSFLSSYAFQPQFEERSSDGVRGGWTRHVWGTTAELFPAPVMVVYAVTLFGTTLVPYFAGSNTVPAALMGILNGGAVSDLGTAFASFVTSGVVRVAELSRAGFGNPIVEWQMPGAGLAWSVTVRGAILGPMAITHALTDTTIATLYGSGVAQEKLESIQLSSIAAFQVTVTWDAATAGETRPRLHAVILPVRGQEAL